MSPRSLTASLITASLITVLLASCAPQTPFYQTPDSPTPDSPTPTPTVTATPTPTPEPITLTGTFDLSPDIAQAFSGAEKYIRREGGQYLVTASYRDPKTGERMTQDFVLDPESFSFDKDLTAKNPLAPATVRASSPLPVGEGLGVREHTLIWSQENREFRLAYSFPTLFEGVGTDSPRLIEENLDAIPFIPIEDIQSGLAVQSVLLAMQQDGYQPFSEEASQAYAKLGGYSLLFELKNNGLKTADLKSWVNWTRSADYPNDGKGITYNTISMKLSPYWIRTEINGQVYDVPAKVLLNPQDAKNPDPNEFLVIFDIPHATNIISLSSPDYDPAGFYRLHNPAIPSSIHLYATNPNLDPNDPNTIVIPSSNPNTAPTLLDRRDPFQALLAQLLGIEGNDASKLEYVPGYAHFPVEFNTFLPQLTNSNNLAETNPFPVPLLPQLQEMIFLFEVGVAQ